MRIRLENTLADAARNAQSRTPMQTRDSADALNQLTSDIIAAAIRIHRAFGPGLLESASTACLCQALTLSRMEYRTQVPLPLQFDGMRIDCAYRADLVVGGSVVVEVKALDNIAPVHLRQLNTYTKLADCRVGLLLNFGATIMKDGIRRVVNGFPEGAVPETTPHGGADALL